MSVNLKKKIRIFTGSVCIICDEKTDSKSIIIHKTRRQIHKLCVDCSDGYLIPILDDIVDKFRKNIRVGITQIKCPGTYHSHQKNRCRASIDLMNLKVPIGSSICLPLFRAQYLISNDEALICPNKKCGMVLEIDDERLHMFCPSCSSEWCRNCYSTPYHVGISCIEHEAAEKNTENGKFIHEMKNQGLLKFCPQCASPTLKNEGCNKIICISCKVKWCWLCKSSGIDYDHFSMTGTNPCASKLWEGLKSKG